MTATLHRTARNRAKTPRMGALEGLRTSESDFANRPLFKRLREHRSRRDDQAHGKRLNAHRQIDRATVVLQVSSGHKAWLVNGAEEGFYNYLCRKEKNMRRLVVLAVATAICAVAKGAVSVEPFPASRKSASAASSAAVPAVQQRYTPVPGGFEIRNGASEFMRPLYGWHGDDDIRQPKRSMPSTSDRPKVALKVFSGMRLDKKARGVLSFGDGTEDVTFRYVWGRAEYDLKGKGTVKMVRSASSDGLLVEVTGDLPPTFDGEWALAAKTEKDGRTYYDFVRKALPRPAGPDTAAAFVAATDRVERMR